MQVISLQVPGKKKCSYDEDDYDNYFEDKQQVCNGSEQNPEFTNHHVLTKSKEKTLKPDLKNAGFPSEIVNEADDVFRQMNCGLKRGTRKKQLMFFCAHTAYNNLGIPEDPAYLASLCGITTSEISKAFSMCSPAKTGYKSPAVNWQPQHYLKYYYKKIMDLDIISFHEDSLKEIEDICSEVMNKNQKLKDEKPQSVAAAVLVFYLQLHGCALDAKKYNEIFQKSSMTVQKIKTEVATTYNS